MADATTQIGNALGEAGISLPKVNLASIGNVALYIIGGILLAGAVIFVVYFVIKKAKWNKNIELYRKVANRIVRVANDKAMAERVGTSGDYWLKTQKMKKTLPRPKIEMAKNTYWFYEREDGEWLNFELADIDAVMKKAGVYYIDEDMRLQRLGVQKNLKDRFMKETFWQKYGATIMLIIFVLFVTIALVVLFQKMTDNWKVAGETAKAIEHMAVAVENMAQRLGGGTVPV